MKPLVSLDVFDTAIFRKVYRPTDIFHVVEETVGGNFYAKRIEAQNKARRKNIYFNIFDIYSHIPQFDLKEEIKAEYANCKANPYILDMYDKGEADYIFISDMHLPEKVIVGMLERCGYKNPRVFVSCDYGAYKSDGKLFRIVEDILGRKIDKHIGDNYNSDIEGSKKAKIPEQEFIGPPIYDKEVVTPELSNPKLRKLLIDEELSDSDIAEKIGYWFAPLTLAFTKSVLDEARDDQTIFFNARDGFLMYIAARWILKTKKKIKYCRFSRKSCFLPNIMVNRELSHPDNKESFKFFAGQKVKTIRELLRVCELDESKNYSTFLKDYGITVDSDIELHPKKSDLILETLLHVQKDLYEVAREARIRFLQYIKNLGMKSNDFFVDIGYVGTMQGIIKRLTGINLKGRYIGTLKNSIGIFQGVQFERKSFFPIDFINPYNGPIMEFIFSEPIGSVNSYSKEGKPIIFGDFKLRKDITRRIVKGVLKGVNDLVELNISPSMEDCMRIMKRYFDNPTVEEASFVNQPIFENRSVRESIVKFEKDYIRQGKFPECYKGSYWKSAFKVLLNNDPEYKFLSKYIK